MPTSKRPFRSAAAFRWVTRSCGTSRDGLAVQVADEAEADNTLPITAAAVYAELGNIEVLLGTI